MSEYYLYFIIGVFLILFFSGTRIYRNHMRIKYMKLFSDYQSLLEYIMGKAFTIIYKDRILIYSLEATKLDDKQFKVITHDFVNLTVKMLGTVLYKELKKLYGSEETLVFTMVEFFNDRYENDEIRKSSMDSITNEEESNDITTR